MSTHFSRCAAFAMMALGALYGAEHETLPYGAEFKLRAGYGLSDPDRLGGALAAVTVGAFHSLGSGRISAELGYQWKSGNQYQVSAGSPFPGERSPDYGADSRRNSLSGVVFRLGYAHPVFSDGLYLQGGLQAGGARFTHEYVGEWQDTVSGRYDDSFNGTPTKSAYGISPFVGVRWDVSRDSGLEFNVLAQSYTSLKFVHTPGAPLVLGAGSARKPFFQGDGLVEQKHSILHLDLAYIFRF
ncbi:hypothetical protein [Geothrix sp. PMB-07]|uniref:hypothetical protein n=1 Tax=Geothrix sp. PMB-07 TaxID=3068640 RepID=UPI002740F8C5|nr:hypothetical protein [Geothrix sp. PMB-07]WLT30915.1 hypothetical protein Q9293_14450 [Geothrix sp. PMB-07]